MSFLSVLKKIGQKVIGGGEQVKEYGAIAQTIAALTDSDKDDKIVAKALSFANDGLVKFQNIILDIEVIGQEMMIPGPMRAVAVAPAILQLFMDLPVIKGKKFKNPETAKVKAAALAAAFADLMNEVEG